MSAFFETADLVVIGAGNGGLVAGAVAASQGLKVLVLEQHNLPGGFASSFRRGRFEFEPALHEPCDVGFGDDLGSVGRCFQQLGLDVDWNRVGNEAYRLVVTDGPDLGLDVTLPTGLDSYINTIVEQVPGSEHSVRKFISLCQEMAEVYTALAKHRGADGEAYIQLNYPNFREISGCTVEEVLDACDVPHMAKALLSGYACYLGMPASELAFNVFGPMLVSYLTCPVVLPSMRSHEISASLAEAISKSGGKIEYNTKATKINVESGKVVGVETSQGDYIKTNHVISNASPIFTYCNMVFPKIEIPSAAIMDTNARKPSGSAFVIYLGLNRSAKDLGIENYTSFLLAGSDVDIKINAEDLDHVFCCATTCLNVVVPDCTPAGTCHLCITVMIEGDAWKDITPQNYYEAKNILALKLIRDTEKTLGLSILPYIEEIEVATPVTLAHFANSYNGVIYGYEQPPWDSFMVRSVTRKDEEKIQGLTFAGAWAFRGAGYSSAYSSGEAVGKSIVKMMKGGK